MTNKNIEWTYDSKHSGVYIIVYVTLCNGNRIDTFIDCDALDEHYKFLLYLLSRTEYRHFFTKMHSLKLY